MEDMCGWRKGRGREWGGGGSGGAVMRAGGGGTAKRPPDPSRLSPLVEGTALCDDDRRKKTPPPPPQPNRRYETHSVVSDPHSSHIGSDPTQRFEAKTRHDVFDIKAGGGLLFGA